MCCNSMASYCEDHESDNEAFSQGITQGFTRARSADKNLYTQCSVRELKEVKEREMVMKVW